ncbi:GNAT family N-acetyltransferase [uncultured Aquimonas sp.]|jgi:RimJ/RimL family protein N-acetyltransferase|uniref:GNAT family N-acetyltransferase n=1 Tax=uncultured Aquimonas sp. TaxID=385483 RepID=UPI000868A4EF|nr:GNAT family N-acetyltransferase [uncultured Aquimonas sp.]ODU42695.1 MAG: GNAT family N-acetyltransferase [Xanthomonadaceae bacterium SCN 69-123]
MPELMTPRLRLRPPEASDFDAWAALMADPESARYIGGVQPRAAAWRGFLCMVGAWKIQGFGMFSVIERRTGQWLGRIGPWQPEGWPGTEVGWGLLTEHQGRGYAREAALACIDWAFDTLGWHEVIHCIDPANLPSQRLAERLGACNSGAGRLPPPFEDAPIEIWRQTRAQWRARPRD